jgi:putative membrane protein (TIGR04086 family)
MEKIGITKQKDMTKLSGFTKTRLVKPSSIAKPKIMSLLTSLIVSYLITGLMLLILALLLYKMNFDEGKVTIGIIAVYIFSCFIGGNIVGRKVGEKKYLWGMILGVVYFVLLLGISTLVQPGSMTGVRYLITSMIMCVGGGMLGGMLS